MRRLAIYRLCDWALTTARDVLSNHPATASKKEALKQQLEMLMAVGEVVDTNGFYEAMRPMLQGVFATANATGGITRRQAVLNGWEFAKALAISPTLTGLQIFQADLYAVGLAALKQVNGTASQPTGLKAAIESLSTSYARLKPVAESGLYGYSGGFSFNNFIDNLWNNGRTAYAKRQSGAGTYTGIEKQSVTEAITDLADHFRNQVNPVKSLQFLDQTLQAATQVRQLHEDAYVKQVPAGLGFLHYSYASSIQDAKFLRTLAELSFEIARVNPTVTAGANPTSEWIETLWEGGNTQSAAGGLSDWFSGFGAEAVDIRRDRVGQALEYANRLIKSARLVDNSLVAEVKRADVLSHLVNLGGTYAALGLSKSSPSKYQSFLDTIWRDQSLLVGGQELSDTLSQFASLERRNEALTFNNKLIRRMNSLSQLSNQSSNEFRLKLSDASFVWEMLDVGNKFISSKDNPNLFVNDLNGFLSSIRFTQADGSIQIASRDIDNLFLIANNRMSILDTLLNPAKSLRYADLGKIADVLSSSQDDQNGSSRQRNINYLFQIFTAAQREQVTDLGQLAFMLGVASHETIQFRTLVEGASGADYERGIEFMNDVVGDGSRYKGRGFVQLTGKLRYFYYSSVKTLNVGGESIDIYNNPDQASNPKVAAAILVDYLKYGRISINADWAYASTGNRPPSSQSNFTDAQMQSAIQPLSRYQFTGTGVASMSSAGLNSQSASYDKFSDVSSVVNAYGESAKDEVASFSVNFFDTLKQFDPKYR
jgi:hypothetical protein